MEKTSEAFPMHPSLFRAVFAAWGCFFVFVVIPLEFLFRIDAFLNYLSPLHILFNALFVMLLYLAISSGIALLCCLICACLKPFVPILSERKRLVTSANIALILLGLIYKLLNTSAAWIRIVAKWDIDPGILSISIIVFSIIVTIGLVLAKAQSISKFGVFSQRGFRSIVIALIAAVLILCAQIIAATATQVQRRHEADNSRPNLATASHPNVILISLDALTANDMSLYGYSLQTTPNLESFSQQCYLFSHAYANSNFTTPTVASILTSKYPISSKVFNYFNFLPPANRQENLAHELQLAGYETIALVDNPAAHPNHNGTFRDFDHAPVIDCLHQIDSQSLVTSFQLVLERAGFHPYPWFGERLEAILPRIESIILFFSPARRASREHDYGRSPGTTLKLAHQYLRRSAQPVFLWVHLLAPHSPYLPADAFKFRFLPEKIFETATSQKAYANSYYEAGQQPLIDKLRLRYDEQIASTDAALGEFLDILAKEGFQKNSIIVITSDHGEQFEKGYYEHGGAGYMGLYQSLIHIPLLIHLPGQTTGQKINGNAEQVDIAPTILDLLKVPAPAWMEGESLKPYMLGQQPTGKPKFAMNLESCRPGHPIEDGSIAVIQDNNKYIYYRRSGKEELFDISHDPQENINLISIFPEKAKEMNRLALQRLGFE